MRKEEEVRQLDSCFNKAERFEPIFVLRAHDKLAPYVVWFWIILAGIFGCNKFKLYQARATARLMFEWGRKKLPG